MIGMKSAFDLGELGLSTAHSTASPRYFPVNLTAARPRILVSAGGKGLVSPAGAVLLVQAMRVTGLDRGLREALGQWRVHGDD
jgi:hypothetical protein